MEQAHNLEPEPTEGAEIAPEDEYLEKGQLSDFIETLNPEQRKMWNAIRRAWKRQIGDARRARGGDNRDELHNAFQRAMGQLNAKQIQAAFDAAIKKGDAQMMRLWAQMAGIDLTERPQAAAGDGAKVIIIRPHPEFVTPEQEADLLQQMYDTSDLLSLGDREQGTGNRAIPPFLTP